jgi:hypothetical protein
LYNISKTCQVKNLNQIYTKYFGYPSKGYFVEVGAYDGELVSNTSCLSDHGWGGLYIEPIYDQYTKCLERHSHNTNIIVKNFSIGLIEGNVDIYDGGVLSCLDKKQVDRYSKIPWSNQIEFKKVICKQTRLDSLMLEVGVPNFFDLLIVDTEGSESEVFKTFDLIKWKPKMIIVELEDEHPSFSNDKEFIDQIKSLRADIASKGYFEIYKDYINTIFISQ